MNVKAFILVSLCGLSVASQVSSSTNVAKHQWQYNNGIQHANWASYPNGYPGSFGFGWYPQNGFNGQFGYNGYNGQFGYNGYQGQHGYNGQYGYNGFGYYPSQFPYYNQNNYNHHGRNW